MKMKQCTSTLALVLVSGLLSSIALGQSWPGAGPGMSPGGGPGMGAGRRAEMGRGSMPGFEAFDANGDGVLTEQEIGEARGQRIAERSQQGYRMRNLTNSPAFANMDLDGDGKVTPPEFAESQARHRQQQRGSRMMPPAMQ